jgi:hypothetical protein
MAIHLYEEWLKESEKVDPVEAPEPTSDLTPEEQAAQTSTDASDEPPIEAPVTASTETELPEADQFAQLDSERRAAITAFKEKQKEYMDIPIDTRKNPVTDEDKQKVEGIKAELITLNQSMKDAIAAYDKFNNQMLDISDEGTDDTVEP